MKYKYVIFSLISFIILTFIIIFITTIKDSKNIISINSQSSKQIEINFISSWAGTDTKAVALEQILNKFQKDNPNIKINNQSISGNEFLFKLKTDFAEGNEPDVFGLWPGSDMTSLINTGKVANLTEMLKSDPNWYNQFQKDNWKYDTISDRIYGLPCEIIYEGLFINDDLFKQYNVAPPKTFSELENAISIFKKNNITPISFNATAEGTFLYQNIVMKLGGKDETENPYDYNGFNDAYLKGLQLMKTLYKDGAFPSNYDTLSNDSRNNLFRNKKAAMIAQGSWFVGDGSVSPSDGNVKIIPFPDFPDENSKQGSIIYGIGNGDFHMSTAAYENLDKKNACIKLLKTLTSKETWDKFNQKTGLISNINTSYYTNEENVLLQNGLNMVKASPELVGPPDSFVDRSAWENILVTDMSNYFTGKTTAEDILRKMYKVKLEK
ncbi:MAG: extracellular solute-binding protein [Bacillota bacterium]|nr:extracellular solute-binding protein [Bacillota bacterium]